MANLHIWDDLKDKVNSDFEASLQKRKERLDKIKNAIQTEPLNNNDMDREDTLDSQIDILHKVNSRAKEAMRALDDAKRLENGSKDEFDYRLHTIKSRETSLALSIIGLIGSTKSPEQTDKLVSFLADVLKRTSLAISELYQQMGVEEETEDDDILCSDDDDDDDRIQLGTLFAFLQGETSRMDRELEEIEQALGSTWADDVWTTEGACTPVTFPKWSHANLCQQYTNTKRRRESIEEARLGLVLNLCAKFSTSDS